MARNNSVVARLICRRLVPFTLLFAAGAAFALAQEFPSRIRGYKLHKTPVSVTNSDGLGGRLKIGVPAILDVSFSGIRVGVVVGIENIPQTGRVDFLTFHDFRINGLPITIDEYREPFKFQKGRSVYLPQPLEVNVGTIELLRAAREGSNEFRGEWTVTGRIFVFGKFRRFGMEFRRVIPVDIDLKIKNPLPSG